MELSESNRITNQNIPTAGSDIQDECSICYEPFTNKAFSSDCLHNFCYQCIYTWVQLRATCPLCLQPITAIIKNVRSIDDYDVEQVSPPQIDVFEEYMRDVPDDFLDYYESSSSSDPESMSMASNMTDFYDDVHSSNDNLHSPHLSPQVNLSPSLPHFFGDEYDDEYNSDEGEEEDELSDSHYLENLASTEDEDDKDEDDKDDDENGDDDENDEGHSENGEFEDNDDEDYDYDDNNNEDDYEDDDDNYEDNVNFSDTCDYDYDDDYDDEYLDHLGLARYLVPSEYDSKKRSHGEGIDLLNLSDMEDSDIDQDHTTSPFTASYVYSCDYC